MSTSADPVGRHEALNRAILDSALDCIITMDSRGIVQEFNPAAQRVFGYSREEAVGHELAELIIPKPLRERHRAGLARYLQTGEGPVLGKRIEIGALNKSGDEFLVELAITAFDLGDTKMFTAYLRDITARVRDERRRSAQYAVAALLAGSLTLSEAATKILETVAHSGDWAYAGIWVVESQTDRLVYRGSWHEPDVALERFSSSSHELELRQDEGLPGRVWSSAKPVWIRDVTVEKSFPRATGALSANLKGAFAFPLSCDGNVNGVVELFSRAFVEPDPDLLEMTDALGSQIGLFIQRRQTAKELQKQKERAEAANAAKDRFLATLSHELRTPLTPVLMWAGDAASLPDVPPALREDLEMVVRNVQLEARLIDDLLDLTRITHGKLILDRELTDAHELLAHAIEFVRPEIEAGHLKLSLDLQAKDHRLNGDPARLQQVFWNVLRNARKFTPKEGVISVRSHNETPGLIVFEVTDTGAGIAPEHLERIFDAFLQLESRPEGLGLGLAISKAIVERHGGTIVARSEGIGTGATFTISLPLGA